jgi:hypothetical protein
MKFDIQSKSPYISISKLNEYKMKKSDENKIKELKRLVSFYRRARKQFDGAQTYKNGCVCTNEDPGLCSFLSRNIRLFTNKQYLNQLAKIQRAVSKSQEHLMPKLREPYFPTNDFRMKFITSNLKRYKNQLDKLQ